jgi:two-component system NtrC family sensor kinase
MQTHLEKIHREALRCQQIVSNLLSFAREQQPRRTSVQINVLLDRTLGLKTNQLRAHGITVVRDYEPDLPPVLADPHQLEQVFLNIITNADEAMSRWNERRLLTIRTEHQEDILRIKVIDTGPGIAPENLKRIFDPFYTTKDVGQGTGLGLSLAYGYVQEHGGSIYATSTGEGGTTLVIELPVSKETGPASAEPPREMGIPPATGRILVVDDEPVVLDLLTRILRQLGYHVDTAGSGKSALRLIRENNYQVVVTDLKMPGMDGRQLYHEISKARSDLIDHIVFITGYALSPDMQVFLKASGRPYIEKPFDINAIRQAIAENS